MALSVGVAGGGLDRDAQGPAGAQEGRGEEHLAPVDHDGVRDDDRPGGGVLQPGVDAHQPGMRDQRGRHAQRLRPSRAHRLRDQVPGQQQGRVHRLGAGRPQHGRADRPGRDVDASDQLDPAGHPVVQMASTSSGVVSIWTTSPGRAAIVGVNGASAAWPGTAARGGAEDVPALGQTFSSR